MQPYFFPYIGYFQLMNLVDTWVIFDEIQYIDKGWINRNRILHPDKRKEWQYITVPLKSRGRLDKICDISINTSEAWQDQLLGKLTSYRRKAPNYHATLQFISDCFDSNETSLSKYLTSTLRATAKVLKIETKILVQSEMNLDFGVIEHPGQWALRISEYMNASEYFNPHGGANIFREDEFEQSRIKLQFIKPELEKYVQRRGSFVPGLSIIDVMMWNDLGDIAGFLQSQFHILGKKRFNGMNRVDEYYTQRASKSSDLYWQVGKAIGGKPVGKKYLDMIANAIESALRLKKTDAVLDIGSGNGLVTRQMATRAGYVYGVEQNRLLYQNALANCAEKNIEYINASVFNIDLKKIGFDKAYMYEVIQHIEYQELPTFMEVVAEQVSRGALLFVGGIPDEERKWEFYNSKDRRRGHINSLMVSGDPLGTWFHKDHLVCLGESHGLRVAILPQEDALYTSHYRFDCLFESRS